MITLQLHFYCTEEFYAMSVSTPVEGRVEPGWPPRFTDGICWEAGLFLTTFTEGCDGVNYWSSTDGSGRTRS